MATTLDIETMELFLTEKRTRKGMTLVELLVVIFILIVLFSIILAAIQGVHRRSNVWVAKCEITQCAMMLEAVKADLGRYPPPVFQVINGKSISTLKALTNANPPCGYAAGWQGPYLDTEQVTDPWNMPYFYRLNYEILKTIGPIYKNNPANMPQDFLFDVNPPGPGILIMDNNGATTGHANRITLNGTEIISPSEFINTLPQVEKDVVFLAKDNLLSVRLTSNPNAYIIIRIATASSKNTGYTLGSYGENRESGGEYYARDLTWTAGQSAPEFD